jgi:uncharacterized protein
MLIFEWDDAKAASNLVKHGIGFDAAKAVFRDPFAVEFEDRTAEYGEIRLKIIGMAGGHLLSVIYTERQERIRMISARKADRTERQIYEANR